jgi:hypothetical protein
LHAALRLVSCAEWRYIEIQSLGEASMDAVSSSGSLQATTLVALQDLKVQQAKRQAQQAESVARSLSAAANAAQGEAERAIENARALYLRSNQAASAAGQARQAVGQLQATADIGMHVAATVSQASERVTGAQMVSGPVVNTSGQVTGTVVNTTA